MGTSIDCIIPKEKDYTIEQITIKLNNVFSNLKQELLHLEKFGSFPNENNNWILNVIPASLNEPEYISGETGSFSIDIYKKVVVFSSIERFSSLYLDEMNISKQLFIIINEMSNVFRSTKDLLIGQGGLGETDIIIDLAFYENADFNEVCNKMKELNGKPTNILSELKEEPWYKL
jgi:hypothetical protein